MFAKNHILIADDDEDDFFLVKSALEDNGFEGKIDFVENGIELLNFLKKNTGNLPDLVLLDLNMPKKDGREVLVELRQVPALAMIPVIVFTTSKAPEDIKTCYANGANCYISKPSSFDDLVVLLDKILQFWLKTALLA
ncbi:MAG: response regulator [Spirosomataceae bacterium]